MDSWCFGVSAVLALAGLPIGIRHAMFVRKGKFSAIEHSKWSFEGLTCVFFLAAIMIYLIDASRPQNLIGVLLLVFTFLYMVVATIFVTSTERCSNQCQRACNCKTDRTPHPKTGWLMLIVLAVRYVTLASLFAVSML
jgi:hypothetical protein